MSYNNGPKIITNGLVLYLDTANTKSYSGTGNTWYDLSGNNKHATINGATFSNNNIGKLSLDGIDDYITTPSISSSSSDGFSVGLWINSSLWNNTTNSCPCGGGTSAILQWELYCNYGFFISYNKNVNIVTATLYNGGNIGIYYATFALDSSNINKWYYLASTFGPADNGFLTCYTNGVQTVSYSLLNTPWGTNSAGGSFSINTGIEIGRSLACCGSCWLKADIANISIYNRKLNTQEVKQNYYAIKSRYGLP